MYPLKFRKCFIEKIWGGRAFEEILNMKLPTTGSYGESWEVSSHSNGMSYVESGKFIGKSLEELVNKFGSTLLGEEVVEKFHSKFPILIKYLDVNDRLSVQVHPNDEYAMRVENEFGKSEAWYIIEASDDAKLIMGTKEGVTKEEFLKKTKENKFDNLFNIISVKKGDCININPGLVHASLEGSVLMCETQQNSDTTYRIYDFDRKVNGKFRELHLGKAADVINFQEKPIITTDDSRISIKLVGAIKQEIIRGKYFHIDKLLVDGTFADEINANFKIYSILDGHGVIIHCEKRYEIAKGDTYLIPARLEVKVEGKVEILKSFI
jgi:mannose-6-phosphate isomerase